MYSIEKKNFLLGELAEEVKLDKISCKFLSDRDVEILSEIGLPDSLSPYISFDDNAKYAGYSLYDRVNKYEEYELDNPYFKDLCYLGNVDFGYIVLAKDGSVQIYDYDRDELVYCNKSLDAFLDCCFEYADFVVTIQNNHGEDALFEGDYTEDEVVTLENKIKFIDKQALEDGFWLEQIDNLYEDMI